MPPTTDESLRPLEVWPQDGRWPEALDTAEFWRKHAFLDESTPAVFDNDCDLLFPSGPGHRLSLRLDRHLVSHELGLLIADGHEEPISLGWMDQAHWHPDVFRWSELQALVEMIHDEDGQRTADYALLLLHEFCPLTSSARASDLEQRLRQVFARFPVLTDDDLEAYLRQVVFVHEDASWISLCDRWVIDGETVHSLRNPENDDFPHELLSELLAG